jgi:hypothetical protein
MRNIASFEVGITICAEDEMMLGVYIRKGKCSRYGTPVREAFTGQLH